MTMKRFTTKTLLTIVAALIAATPFTGCSSPTEADWKSIGTIPRLLQAMGQFGSLKVVPNDSSVSRQRK